MKPECVMSVDEEVTLEINKPRKDEEGMTIKFTISRIFHLPRKQRKNAGESLKEVLGADQG